MSLAQLLYSNANLPYDPNDKRSFADRLSHCVKAATDAGRVEVRLTPFNNFDQVTLITYFDSSGKECAQTFIPGDPFGLAPPGDPTPSALPPGITDFYLLDEDGNIYAQLTGFAPVPADEFRAMFVDMTTSLNIYDDLVALTNGGVVGVGTNVNDTFDLGNGRAEVTGGQGNDQVNKIDFGKVVFAGGKGTDTLSFQSSEGDAFRHPFVQQMVVNLTSGSGKNPYGGKLTLTGVENVIGTSAADRIIGNDRANIIGDGFADGGADTINARGGDDIVRVIDPDLVWADGGEGFDTFVFVGSIDLQDPGFASRVTGFEKFQVSSIFILTPPSTLRGDDGANWFACDNGRDTLEGRGGNDTLDGGDALNNDFTPGADVAVWSGGRNQYAISAEGGTITVTDLRTGSPDGTDTVVNIEVLRFKNGDVTVADLFPDLGKAFFGTNGDDGVGAPFGTTKNVSAYGFAGNDTLSGGLGDDLLVGGTGDDTYIINGGTDRIVERAGEGTDTLVLEFQSDLRALSLVGLNNVENLRGEDFHALTLTGNALDNVISSFNGADTLIGGKGNDTLAAWFGADVLTGGGGRDVFVIEALSHSSVSLFDTITDFSAGGDRIDLSAIDALAGGADDAFAFIGSGAFTALGQLRVFQSGGNTIVEANATGDLAADMRILLTGLVTLGSGDFVL